MLLVLPAVLRPQAGLLTPITGVVSVERGHQFTGFAQLEIIGDTHAEA